MLDKCMQCSRSIGPSSYEEFWPYCSKKCKEEKTWPDEPKPLKKQKVHLDQYEIDMLLPLVRRTVINMGSDLTLLSLDMQAMELVDTIHLMQRMTQVTNHNYRVAREEETF
jgi:endogenous inhibitor of DNA gyrase (YacG/DUF329 family)